MNYLFFILMAALGSCASQKKQKAATEPTSAECPLFISFYSKGAGIDYEIAQKLDLKLEELQAKSKLTYEKTGWGREGEIDFCIRYNDNLKKSEHNDLENQIKSIISSSKLYHWEINSANKHKRKD